MSLDKVYRIKSVREYNSYGSSKKFKFKIQRRVKFLFISIWVDELSDTYDTIQTAENYLKSYLEDKHFIKYFCIISNFSVFDGETLVELEKKTKLKAFL